MTGRVMLRQAILPAYIFLCVVLGGSAQSIWGVAILQLLGIALIGWAIARPAAGAVPTRIKALLWIAIAALALIILQLIPLPPQLWTQLPGREFLVQGYRALGEPLPWLPVSMAPEATASSVLFLLPPLAVILAMSRLDACRPAWAVGSILGAAVVSVLLGYLQVSTRSSFWYLYQFTNVGSAVGFFANHDHMGTLLVIAIPIVGAVLGDAFERERRKSLPVIALAFSCGLAVLAGVAMNGSLAAVLLALPVLAATALLFDKARSRMRSWGLVGVLCLFMVSLALLADSPVEGKLTGTETASMTGRQEIWRTSMNLGLAAFPFGTGFGSFEQAYHFYEDPAQVTPVYVNHAHDDYVELFVEGGLAAILMVAAFLVWWIAAAREAWRQGTRLARAATIASAAVLAHSVVDFPIRTSAIAALSAFCIATMAGACARPPEFGPERGERRARHVTVT